MASLKSQEMFSEDGKSLLIFKNFKINIGLQKHNGNNKNRDRDFANISKQGRDRDRSGDDDDDEWNDEVDIDEEDGDIPEKKFKAKVKMKDGKQTVVSVQDFFKSAKNGAENLEILGERALGYEAALAKAKASGQTALLDALKRSALLFRMEAQLFSQGITKFLSENTLVELATKCEKGLRLDWLENFARVIPDPIITSKNKLDTLCIFDNYVILHYDPENKGAKETEEQITKRKDPIMFGVIDGRRRLYYVGDWVDEYCNLTLDEIVTMIGKEYIGNTQDFKPE